MKHVNKNKGRPIVNKKMKSLIVCTILVTSFTPGITTLHAAERSGTTTVVAEFTDADLFKFEVHVGVGGRVLKGESVIENGSVTYQLSLDDDPTFVIAPHKGYIVKSIVYEKPEQKFSEDITYLMKDAKVSIDTEATEMQLYITFEKVDEPEEPKVEEPKVEEPKVQEPKVETPKVEAPKQAISTGDQTEMMSYLGLLSISLFFILFKKKKDEEEEEKENK